MAPIPWPYFLVLRRPRVAQRNLVALHERGVIDGVPTPFQMLMGVLYMVYRLVFRSDTVGLETRQPVRDTWRARLLRWRPLRFPFLAWERVFNPFDLTGFGSRRDFLVRHLVGAHHAGDDAIYDLVLLLGHDDALDEVEARCRAVIEGRTAHDRFLADLCVYEHYHEHLLDVIHRVREGQLAPADADIASDTSLPGFVAWCLQQPPTLRAGWDALREGRLRLDPRTA